MARRKNPPKENHERWLVSYADLVTLLFAFFVVLFASTQTDHTKAKQISEAVEKALGEGAPPPKVTAILGGAADDVGRGNAMLRGPAVRKPEEEKPAPLDELASVAEELRSQLKPELVRGDVDLHVEERGIIIGLNSAVFFSLGDDAIDDHASLALARVATILQRLPNDIRVEGHTDSLPIATARFRDNWDLSAARGIALLRLLNERYGIDRSRLAVVGYADTAALASNDTEEGRQRNRRVDLVVVSRLGLRAEPKHSAAPPPMKTTSNTAAH